MHLKQLPLWAWAFVAGGLVAILLGWTSSGYAQAALLELGAGAFLVVPFFIVERVLAQKQLSTADTLAELSKPVVVEAQAGTATATAQAFDAVVSTSNDPTLDELRRVLLDLGWVVLNRSPRLELWYGARDRQFALPLDDDIRARAFYRRVKEALETGRWPI